MLRYPVKLSKDTNASILVDVPDIPEAHTFGEDRDEALARAADAIETALMGYIEDRRDIPIPRAPRSKQSSKEGVTLPALTEAKLELYMAMRTGKVGKAELARRLNCHLPQGRPAARSRTRLSAGSTGSRISGTWKTTRNTDIGSRTGACVLRLISISYCNR